MRLVLAALFLFSVWHASIILGSLNAIAFAFINPGTFFHPMKNPAIKQRKQNKIKVGIFLFEIFFDLTFSLILLVGFEF